MNKKKIGIILLLIVFVLSISPAFAVKYKITRKSVSTSTALTLPAGTWVYGIGIYATTTNAQMAIYNAATFPACIAPIDEVGEATQYNRVNSPWIEPINFSNGVSVIITNGIGFIDYATTY